MSAQHTHGRLTQDGYIFRTDNGNGGISDTAEITRRVIACWNACEGISTEDFTRYYSKRFGIDAACEEASLRAHVKAYTERGELLAALTQIANEIRNIGSAHIIARAAIAKATGGEE